MLCCSFMDLDDVIVQRAGRSIPEIFANDGEAAFRQMERDVLRDIINSRHCEDSKNPWQSHNCTILALGGGAVMQEVCEKMVHEDTVCIYLKASVDTLLSHLEGGAAGRPLLNSQTSLRERILDLMDKRAATYERVAHHIIDTDGKNVSEIAREIIQILP